MTEGTKAVKRVAQHILWVNMKQILYFSIDCPGNLAQTFTQTLATLLQCRLKPQRKYLSGDPCGHFLQMGLQMLFVAYIFLLLIYFVCFLSLTWLCLGCTPDCMQGPFLIMLKGLYYVVLRIELELGIYHIYHTYLLYIPNILLS